MDARIGNLEYDVKDIRRTLEKAKDDRHKIRVGVTKLEGDLHALDLRLSGKLDKQEVKFDAFVENTHDRRSETKERLKVGGIIASCCIAVASFIYSFFK